MQQLRMATRSDLQMSTQLEMDCAQRCVRTTGQRNCDDAIGLMIARNVASLKISKRRFICNVDLGFYFQVGSWKFQWVPNKPIVPPHFPCFRNWMCTSSDFHFLPYYTLYNMVYTTILYNQQGSSAGTSPFQDTDASKKIHISRGLTRSAIDGCIHIFRASATGSARLWIFIAEQICRSGKWYVLRFGGGLLGAEAPLFCARLHIFTGNVQMRIFCLSGGFCFKSVAHHPNLRKKAC